MLQIECIINSFNLRKLQGKGESPNAFWLITVGGEGGSKIVENCVINVLTPS